jgi:hypothetical protein
MLNNKTNMLEELFTCPICYSVMNEPVTTICGHNFCQACINMSGNECPICRKKLSKYEITPNYQIKDNIEKLKKLTQDSQHVYRSPPAKINKENSYYCNAMFNGNSNGSTSKYRVKRKFDQINFSPPRVKSEVCYSKIGFNNGIVKTHFINTILNDFRELEEYDIFNVKAGKNEADRNIGYSGNGNGNGVGGGLQYNMVEFSMQENGPFSRRFKYT